MDASRARQQTLKLREDELLRQWQTTEATHARRDEVLSWALLVVSALCAGRIAFLFKRLRDAERFITMCAWSRTVEHDGRWLQVEQFLEERFGFKISHGISPEEAPKVFTRGRAKD